MTLEEKIHEINRYCDCKRACTLGEEYPCPLNHSDCEHLDIDYIERCFEEVSSMPDYTGKKEDVGKKDVIDKVPDEDVINHPSHYTNGGMECIDEMVLIFGKEATMKFCLLNAWKYRKRALFKNGQEDMNKSDAYLRFYKSLKENGVCEF